MILPLWNGVSELEILAQLAGRPKPTGPELVQETYTKAYGGDASKWNLLVRNGFQADSALPETPLTFNAGQAADVAKTATPVSGELELVFLASSSVDDGRYANNTVYFLSTASAWVLTVLNSPLSAAGTAGAVCASAAPAPISPRVPKASARARDKRVVVATGAEAKWVIEILRVRGWIDVGQFSHVMLQAYATLQQCRMP